MSNQSSIRQVPHVAPRVETGPLAFGDDWPGIFIRGDHAAHYAFVLRLLLDTGECDPISHVSVRQLLSDLESCNLVKRHD